MSTDKDELMQQAMVAYLKAMTIADPIRLRFWDNRGLTMPQLRIMVMLSLKKGATPGFLAEQMHVTPSTITGLTDRLVKQALIEREEDRKDRRLVRLRLTEEGCRAIVEIESAGRAFMLSVLGKMPPTRLKRLAELLDELWAAAEAVQTAKRPL